MTETDLLLQSLRTGAEITTRILARSRAQDRPGLAEALDDLEEWTDLARDVVREHSRIGLLDISPERRESMPTDTVRVGDRDMPLAEIAEQAQRPSFRYSPQYEGCAVVILALVAAVRALRAQVAADHEIDEHGGCRLCTPPAVSLEDSAFPCAVRRALLGETDAR